jgi:beta-galactosidase
MTRIYYTSECIMKDDRPWFPVMGEMHYSRYPNRYWEESLYKIKAGGIDIVSTYVIWIHHEEIEGRYDFTGDRNLREFVRLSEKCGLYLFLRIGPWCHGEVRNGGFPDWLLQKGFIPRSNDPGYLAQAYRFYKTVYEQVKGCFLKDGGPILGVQIENEYGHCGGLTGEEGERHMRTLLGMAKEIGYDVPLYTATGWGGAVTGGMLPVMGGYCDAPWDPCTDELEPSGNYIFTHERNDHNIGSDYGFGEGVTFDIGKYPYLTAELGGGLQVTRHRRPVATAHDIGAMSLVKIGSGVNMLGYYMYHGGTNPKGILTSLEESRDSGSINDLPALSYDFRAPIREYGQISETYRELKLLAMFLRDFGGELCGMRAHIPPDNPLNPKDLVNIRTSVRHNGKYGYIFVNNYQRRYAMAEHPRTELQVKLEGETVSFPPIDIRNGDYFFLPFNLPICGAVIKTTLASPLCMLNMESRKDRAAVFYTDCDPQYRLQGSLDACRLITIKRRDALDAWKLKLDREYLVISRSAVLQTGKSVECIGRGPVLLKTFPALPVTPEGFCRLESEEPFSVYLKEHMQRHTRVDVRMISKNENAKEYELDLTYPDDCYDFYLKLNYAGDSFQLYRGKELLSDDFYAQPRVEISMRRFGFPKRLRIRINALRETDAVFIEDRSIFRAGIACVLNSAVMEEEYHDPLIGL